VTPRAAARTFPSLQAADSFGRFFLRMWFPTIADNPRAARHCAQQQEETTTTTKKGSHD
jgi:hypothetical protein